MRRTITIHSIVVAALCSLVGCSGSDGSPPTGPSGPSPAPAAAASLLQRDVDRIHAVGVVGVAADLLTTSGETVARAGTTTRGGGEEVPLEGFWRVGSTTKAYVAATVMRLVADGRLSLNDSVDRWLPGLLDRLGSDAHDVTIRDLLQQTSGVPDYYPMLPLNRSLHAFRQHRFDPPTERGAVRLALSKPQRFPAGTDWSYSNTNYTLLGLVIEAVTSHPWFDEVQQQVLAPLGLHDTVLLGQAHVPPDPHADAYDLFSKDGRLVDVTGLVDNSADGGIIATTADVDRFFAALLQGRVVPAEELQRMQQTVPAKELRQFWPGVSYGLGLIRLPLSCGGFYWGHSGDTWGTMTRDGVTADGSRAVTVAMSTEFTSDPQRLLRQDALARDLVDDALCAGSGPTATSRPATG